MGEAEGDELGFLEGEPFVKEAIEVDVEGAAVTFFEEDVLAVAIAETEDVADNGHDGAGAGVAQSCGEPGGRFRKHFDKPFVEDRGKLRKDLGLEDRHFLRGGSCFVEEVAQLTVVGLNILLFVDAEKNVSEGFEVIDPFDESTFFVQRGYGVGFDVETAFTGICIFLQGAIDHSIKLH